MAKQAEAEREKRAKITLAEGEKLAAQQLADAARTLSSETAGLQLRYLQTLGEIAGTNSSTTIFPFPIDLLSPFVLKPTGLPGTDGTDDGGGSIPATTGQTEGS